MKWIEMEKPQIVTPMAPYRTVARTLVLTKTAKTAIMQHEGNLEVPIFGSIMIASPLEPDDITLVIHSLSELLIDAVLLELLVDHGTVS